MTTAAEPSDPAGTPVSLTEMLAAREDRAARQRAALDRLALPVVSVTVVMPGPVKDSRLSRDILGFAAAALDRLFDRRGWRVALAERHGGPGGPEALYAVAAQPQPLKQALADLEEAHPLGRLWDLDVIDPQLGPLGRASLGRPPRRCLVCDGEAHACARSQAHPLAELLAAIEARVDAYRRSHAL